MGVLEERIKTARDLCGLTQKELCQTLDITEMTIYRWENGKSIPRLDKLEKLAELAQKPLYWFFLPNECTVIDAEAVSSLTYEILRVCQSLNLNGQARLLSLANDLKELDKYSKKQ
jgi:transcriptional regulator with XRE-family HTH domain